MSKTALPLDTLKKASDIHPSAYIAPGAHVIGEVILKKDSSVWYTAVLRGDINKIIVGERSNIQDGCIIHLENERPCIIGNDVTVGHGAILHGCEIEDGCLIGMGAIILNGALIKKGAVIAAGAVIKENMIVDSLTLVGGVPGKYLKDLPPSTYDTHINWAKKYVGLAKLHLEYQNSKSSST